MGGERGTFLTTHWSLIEDAKKYQDKDRALIGLLLERYWKPVYCYLRRKGYDNEQAKDLTQGFFHEVVLNRDLVGRADESRGRFRTFLLHALKQYAGKKDLKEAAQKHILEEKLVRFEMEQEEPIIPDSVTQTTAEQSYHYAWLTSILERVLKEVKDSCQDEGMDIHWALFNKRIVWPIFSERTAPSLAELCESYDIKDAKKVSNMIITVKRRFKAALMQHIRNTVLSQSQVPEELEDLLQFFPKSAQHFQ